LSVTIREAIADPGNRLYLSAASTWEIIIKSRLGKLVLPDSPQDLIEKQLRMNAVEPLPITIDHTLSLASLPDIHKDPFDRMLIAQANCEGLTLMSDDPLIKQYQVSTFP
jgi:PIN domain nuclease of toxin-antitoxin system